MGCSTSRIDHLPAVSLCHDRCKFLEEALYQSYALADAHLSYMHSLKTLGPTLTLFFDQNLDRNNGHSDSTKPKSVSSPDHYPSSSNSDSHLDFPSDDPEDEGFKQKDIDLLHRINTDFFERQTPTPSRTNSYSNRYYINKYDYYGNNSTYGAISPPTSFPPPPPPPSGSTWEFLNFFDAYDRYEPPSKDKEGVEEVKGQNDNAVLGKEEFDSGSINLVEEEKKQSKTDNVKKNEAPIVETKVVTEKVEKKESVASLNRSPLMVIKELETLFGRAAESGNEVSKILDTGKFRYYHKNSLYQGVSLKKFDLITPSSAEKTGSVNVGFDEDLEVISVNLSSTLKKLCIWEKKLYDEVKAEEKLRIMLVRSYKQIRNLSEKGSDSNKVETARDLIRTLSTKIKVAIHVIDRTTITINKLRDEELWPVISELIQKSLGMWKAMLDCHKCQSQVILDAKGLDAIVSNGKFSETHLEAAIQLKIEIQNWNLNFSEWIVAQKFYVRALNSWLLKCLPNEPEEMPDETSSSTGEPPLFAFCNQWWQAAGRISEAEVINAMNGFFMNVNQLVERHYTYLQQMLTVDKDLEKRIKILERKDKQMQKVMQARGMKIKTQFSGGAVHQSEVISNSSLHFGLKQIFMAIEKLCDNNVQVYEELHVQIQERTLNGRNSKDLY